MANLITITPMINGSKLGSYKVDVVGDGSGDEAGAVILDPANMTGHPAKFKIRALQWDDLGADATLLWQASANVQAWNMPKGISGGIRFSDTGAHLVNNAGAGVTGRLLLATSGLLAGGRLSFYIETQAAPTTL